MKLIPRDSRHGISIFRLALTLTIAALVPLLAYAAAPAWWSQRGVLVQNGTADDYALVNQGQLKNIARAAVLEMDAGLPEGAGSTLHALVDAWASPTGQTNDYAPVNLGQLKNIAKPFYDRLIAAGLADAYPWSGSSNQPDDFALANIGQVKELFSFDLPNPDSDGNGLLDAWELQHFGHIGVDPNADPDGDGFTNLQEHQNATDPNDYYNGTSPQLVLLAGDGQTVKIDSNAPRAFELLVLKADGTPLPNAPVTFAVASGEGLLASDATPGAPLFASLTARADYSGRVRPPVATVLYHASSSPGVAVVQASAQSTAVQFSVTVTIDGPLAAPTLLSATQDPEDGSALFEWSLPPSGIPAASSIALLGRGADGVWHTIASLSSSAISYSAVENEIAPFVQFALRVFPEGNGNPSPLSNILGISGGGSSGGGSSGLPAYAVIELGTGRYPQAVASDGTVVLYDGLFYRRRGQLEEVLDGSFSFGDMNDLGDIVGTKQENEANSAYAILASNPASVLTRWAGAGHGGNSYLATDLRRINEKRSVTGAEYRSERLGPNLWFISGTTFTSTVPLSLNTIASWSYTYNTFFGETRTGETGSSYNFRDLDNHGRGVGREDNIFTHTETSLYFGFGDGPRPPGGNAFDPTALNDDGLVLGISNNVVKLWEPLTGYRTLALPNTLEQDSPMRITDPPLSDPDKMVIILAGNNVVYRTWKDADGHPSDFPIYTTRAAADLLPPDSPFYNLSLRNISNNGIIVAIARKMGDESNHAIMVVPVQVEKLWSDQLIGITDANYLPNKTGQGDKAYLLMGAAQSSNFDLKGHLKAKVRMPGLTGLQDKILWRLAGKSGGNYIPENGSSTYGVNGDEVTIVLDNPRTDEVNSYYLVAGYDQDGSGQLSTHEVSIVPIYRWEHNVNGQVVKEDHNYEVKIVARSTYNQSRQEATSLANTWDGLGLDLSAHNMRAFLTEGTPIGATDPAPVVMIGRDEPGLTHSLGVLFQPPGNPGLSIKAEFSPNSEMTQAVLDSNKLYYWLAAEFQGKREEVDQRFRNSQNTIEIFYWQFNGGDLEFERNPLQPGTSDPDLGFALGRTKISPVDVEVAVHRALYTVESVIVTGVITDLYDFDYDGAPQWPDWVRDSARVQAGYNTLGTGGRVYKSEIQMLNSHCSRLEGNFQFQ